MSIFNDDYSYQTHKDGDGDPFDDDYLMQINNHKAPITADDLYEDYSNPVTRRRTSRAVSGGALCPCGTAISVRNGTPRQHV